MLVKAKYTGCPKKPKSIGINALFEFECPLNLNAKMRKRNAKMHKEMKIYLCKAHDFLLLHGNVQISFLSPPHTRATC